MKKALLSCFIAVLFAFVLSGCQLFESIFGGDSTLLKLAKNTAPYVVSGSKSVAAKGVAKAFGPGGSTYKLYAVFQEYSYPEDEGVIDTGNIYKLIYEASSLYQGNKSLASAIPLTPIDSPFDFGTAAESYDHGYNETAGVVERGNTYYKTLAYREDGTNTHALLGYTVEELVTGGTKTQR